MKQKLCLIPYTATKDMTSISIKRNANTLNSDEQARALVRFLDDRVPRATLQAFSRLIGKNYTLYNLIIAKARDLDKIDGWEQDLAKIKKLEHDLDAMYRKLGYTIVVLKAETTDK